MDVKMPEAILILIKYLCKISISIFAHFSFCIRPKMKPDFTLAILEALNRWMVWQWLRWKTLD